MNNKGENSLEPVLEKRKGCDHEEQTPEVCGSGEKTERLTVLPGGVRFECSDRAARELSEGEEREVSSFSGFTEVTYVGLRQTEYARLDEGTTQVSDEVCCGDTAGGERWENRRSKRSPSDVAGEPNIKGRLRISYNEGFA